MNKENRSFKNRLMLHTGVLADGIYSIIAYLLLIGTAFLFLYATSPIKPFVIFVIYIIIHVISIAAYLFIKELVSDWYTGKKRETITKSVRIFFFIITIILILILAYFNFKICIVASVIVAINIIFTRKLCKIDLSYNIHGKHQSPIETFPTLLTLFLILSPIVVFLIALFAFTSFSILVKILLSIVSIIAIIVLYYFLCSFL
ncbi:MAG: hypothetical protein HFJ41_00490 [Clostridia bacterium]|nr:hypothetical protein [Clostridia bacterium]